uniref:Checkpoint protein n=2 Tax=Meloidogyne TaxID=189290 RepID=A0A914KYU1_MELIC
MQNFVLQIRLIGAETALQFRDALIEIPSPHHTLTIHWRGWRVDIYSLQSPFEVRALAGSEMLRINCYQEALTVDVFADSITVDVKRLSRLLVNRSSSFPPSLLRVNGAQISSPQNDNNESNNIIDLAELLSRQLHLALSRDGNQNNSSAAVLADARNSQLKLARANRTTATLTALRHFVEMLGGQPQLQLLAGNVSVRMSAGHDEEIFFLDTKILPRELLEPEATLEQDPFGIGWFLELRGDVINGKGHWEKIRRD